MSSASGRWLSSRGRRCRTGQASRSSRPDRRRRAARRRSRRSRRPRRRITVHGLAVPAAKRLLGGADPLQEDEIVDHGHELDYRRTERLPRAGHSSDRLGLRHGAVNWDQRPQAAEPGADLLVQGLERRRRVRLHRRCASSRPSGTPSGFGAIDPEEFFDFQVTRPDGHADRGPHAGDRVARARRSRARAASTADRDVVFLSGTSRTCAGRTSRDDRGSRPRELGVELVVSLGALLADVPHTRPVQITGIAGDAELAERLGFTADPLRGPDRDRRRAARRVRPGRDASRPACGRRCRTTSRRCRARRRRSR